MSLSHARVGLSFEVVFRREDSLDLFIAHHASEGPILKCEVLTAPPARST
jgi:hypothetical protein